MAVPVLHERWSSMQHGRWARYGVFTKLVEGHVTNPWSPGNDHMLCREGCSDGKEGES